MFLARGGDLIEDAAVESGVLIALGQRRVAEPSDPLEAPACDGARAVARLRRSFRVHEPAYARSLGPAKLWRNNRFFVHSSNSKGGQVSLGTAACVLHTAVMGEDGYQMPYLHHDGRCEPDYISLLASSKYMFQACDLMLEYRRDGPARLMTFDDDMNETRTFLWRIEHVVFMVCVRSSLRFAATSGWSPAR